MKEQGVALAAKIKVHFGTAVAAAKRMLEESEENFDPMEGADDSSSD